MQKMVKCASPPSRTIAIGLNKQIVKLLEFGLVMPKIILPVNTRFSTQKLKKLFDPGRDFSTNTQVEKHAVLTASYEGLDEDKMFPVVINNGNVNVVSNSNSNSSEEDLKNNEENFFD